MRKFLITSLAACGIGSLAGAMLRADDDLVIRKGTVIEKNRPAAANAAAKPATAAPATAAPAAGAAAQGAKAPVAEAKPAAKRKGQLLSVKAAAGQSAGDAWDAYFAAWKKSLPKDEAGVARKQRELEQDLRETARRLMGEQKFGEVVTVLEASLRSGSPQPWMYEAMSIAMQAAKSPQADLERALMSAADFAVGDADQLMYLGHYMTRVGLDRRAIKIFKDVAQLDTSRPEPLVAGLAAAQRLGDLDSIRWATVAVLSQEWTTAERKVKTDALREAQATLAKLNKDGKADLAKEFEKELNEALSRDVIVRVSWTGDADIDLSIVEPSGTVCSFRDPRTTSGGVILGDTFSREEANRVEAYSETYVCPKAYAGAYQVMLRKIWGKVTSGQVKVEVITPKSDKPAVTEVDLADGTNVIRFDLPEGRRNEPLAQVRVANAVRDQAVIGREILAQQLGGALDPAAIARARATRAALANSGTNALNALTDGAGGILPVGIPVVQGAVGFRPVITTLPEGANLAANAVISADRRYVRITVLPLFSKVGKVLAFNIITGRITNGNPDFPSDGNGGGAGGGGAGGGVER